MIQTLQWLYKDKIVTQEFMDELFRKGITEETEKGTKYLIIRK